MHRPINTRLSRHWLTARGDQTILFRNLQGEVQCMRSCTPVSRMTSVTQCWTP
jgi:hypothetical protein